MIEKKTIKTKRLILRPWQERDLERFAQLNADQRVMEYFPEVKNFQDSLQEYNRIVAHFEKYGWGLWAVSLINSPDFIGFIGLTHTGFNAPFTPAVDIGWRLAFDYWGKGYATEGAMASLRFGFENLQLNEIVSFTALQNFRSRRVMEKLGMHHDSKDDFDHPKISKGHWIERHVLYRIKSTEWDPAVR